MTLYRVLAGLACVLALSAAPAARAAQSVSEVGLSGQLSDAAGDLFTLDGGTVFTGLSGETDLSFSNAYLNLTRHLQLIVIDGGVVDNSHIITFRLLDFPDSPFLGNPGQVKLTGRDANGAQVGVDAVLGTSPGWNASNTNDFFNITYFDLNFPEVSDFTVDFPVPEPSTWALMLLGVGAIGASLRRRRAAAVEFLVSRAE